MFNKSIYYWIISFFFDMEKKLFIDVANSEISWLITNQWKIFIDSSFISGLSFSFLGSNLIERFNDQFHPLLGGQNMSWPSDSTIIRMPLSSACLKDGLETGIGRIKEISSKFLDHASRSLLFLKSVVQVWYHHGHFFFLNGLYLELCGAKLSIQW